MNAPASTAGTAPLLQMRGISKHFGGLQALKDVDLTLHAGELLAIVGDNGAGKSTLIKVLTGVYPPDGGSISLDGQPVRVPSRRASIDLGIDAVYQNLALVDYLTAPENVYLGNEIKRSVLGITVLDNRGMRKNAAEVLNERLGVALGNIDQMTFNLSGGQRQAVAIARALIQQKVRILILDEPTAALGPEEARRTLEVVQRLKGKDMGIIMISHQLEHVFELADRIMVMRRGRLAGVRTVAQTTRQEILGLIVGSISDYEADGGRSGASAPVAS
ncbi:MAG: ATP-binding cassette domain-containing protein [Trueperaceae bacterium]|nr:ATP-binding cassette domain-containing protein [Trueperaceae bacterium]